MIPFFLFIFGLIIGSFLNVVICRLKSGEGIMLARSKCPNCGHVLGFLDLVPLLSFICLKARCRYCQKKISWQYPLVELATAIIFAGGYVVLKNNFFGSFSLEYFASDEINYFILSYLAYLLFSGILIVIFVYDLKHFLILDKISLPAAGLALLFNYFLNKPLVNLLLAGVIGAGFFLAQYLISRGRWIGGGDLRLGLFMGFILGWPQVLSAILIAYIGGAVIGLLLILFKKKGFKSEVPFGPYLAAATLIMMLFGDSVMGLLNSRLHILW